MKNYSLKYYLFDVDNNLFHMDTKIHMERNGTPIALTTSEFAKHRNDKSFKFINNDVNESMREFRDSYPDKFLDDAIIAINKKQFAPSFGKFKMALILGRMFAIITARGHSSDNIKKMVRYVINNVLTHEERKFMISNLMKFQEMFNIKHDDVIEQYLNENHYIGVSSDDFTKQFNGDIPSIEECKIIAINTFVDLVNKKYNCLDCDEKSISIGFSDDDKKLFQAVHTHMVKFLQPKYPHIRFRMYDSSDAQLVQPNKIVI